MAQLELFDEPWFRFFMGRMLDHLLRQSPVYEVRRDKDGYLLVGKPDHVDAFSDLVRAAADKAGDDFIVFTTSDGRRGYSQMFVMPLDSDRRERAEGA